MGLLGKIFKKKDGGNAPRGFINVTVLSVESITSDMMQINLDTSNSPKLKSFIPGQYITVAIEVNGSQERRSYSICSNLNEELAFAVKRVENGVVSNWLCDNLSTGSELLITEPEGNFTLNNSSKNLIMVAAGSGITPILSMLKNIEEGSSNAKLFFGNKNESSIPFKSNLDGFKNTKTNYFLSQEEKEGFSKGRIDKEKFNEIIKSDLDLLKADGFYLCGPEEMINDVRSSLETFGVSKDKIHFELFTVSVKASKEEKKDTNSFKGTSKVSVLLDGENIELDISSEGQSILDAVSDAGYDPSYSCRGGVCCSCKAKVTEGTVEMTINYALTDKEVEEGMILTCQAHPTSDVVKLTYDD